MSTEAKLHEARLREAYEWIERNSAWEDVRSIHVSTAATCIFLNPPECLDRYFAGVEVSIYSKSTHTEYQLQHEGISFYVFKYRTAGNEYGPPRKIIIGEQPL